MLQAADEAMRAELKRRTRTILSMAAQLEQQEVDLAAARQDQQHPGPQVSNAAAASLEAALEVGPMSACAAAVDGEADGCGALDSVPRKQARARGWAVGEGGESATAPLLFLATDLPATWTAGQALDQPIAVAHDPMLSNQAGVGAGAEISQVLGAVIGDGGLQKPKRPRSAAYLLRTSNSKGAVGMQLDHDDVKSLVVQVEVLGKALATAEWEVASCRYVCREGFQLSISAGRTWFRASTKGMGLYGGHSMQD